MSPLFSEGRGASAFIPPLDRLLVEIRGCRYCASALPLGPRPIIQAGASSRLLIIGQAPGRVAHETGVPWNDPSGDRLRDWIGLGRENFYDPAHVALLGMGFCYPGRARGGADARPRPECAPLWHESVLRNLVEVRLTLLVGRCAQTAYLGPRAGPMAEVVRAHASLPKGTFPLPHPSWRNNAWLGRNPWFVNEILPVLRDRVRDALAG